MSTGEIAELAGLIYNGMHSSSALASYGVSVGGRCARPAFGAIRSGNLLLVQSTGRTSSFSFSSFVRQGIY
jgi:hypothetical protein